MKDAGTYFADYPSNANGFQLTLPSGLLYSPDTTGSANSSALVTLPTGNGSTTAPPVSSTERLVITGSTTGTTVLLSQWQLFDFIASPGNTDPSNPIPFSHFTIENMKFDRNKFATSQGSLVATAMGHGLVSVVETLTTTTGSSTTSTTVVSTGLEVVVDANQGPNGILLPGFNTPDFGFQPASISGNGGDQQYLRLYDNVSVSGTKTPMMDALLNSPILNTQLFYHGVCGGNLSAPLDNYESFDASAGATTTASFACPSTGSTWTMLLSSNPGALDSTTSRVISSYGLISANASPIACLKNEATSGDFLLINNQQVKTTPNPGVDVVLQNLTFMAMARSTIYNTVNVSASNLSIVREPAASGQLPCLATESGGLQINGSAPYITYGNSVVQYHAIATGDDSVAFFGDVGGTAISGGSGTYAVSSVINSVISDSFARDILIVPFAAMGQEYPYSSNVNVYPYAGFNSSGSGFCSGDGYEGQQGYNPTLPYPPAVSCPSASYSNTNTITNIYYNCPYVGKTATNTVVYCPVRVLPQ